MGTPQRTLYELHSSYCALFGNANRLMIMDAIKDGECSVGEIAERVGMPIQGVSQHLRLMRDRGVVTCRREGRAIFYRIANRKFLRACCLIREGLLEEEKKRARLLR